LELSKELDIVLRSQSPTVPGLKEKFNGKRTIYKMIAQLFLIFSSLTPFVASTEVKDIDFSQTPGITLFKAYNGYPPCFRQPLIVSLDSSRLIVFAEGRNNSYCSGSADGSNSSIHSRYSEDGGLTWSPMQELYHAPPMPDYLSAVSDPSTGSVHLFIQTSPNLQLTTLDGGKTFSDPKPVSITIPTGYSATPGVATGITISGDLCSESTCAGTTGRLVVAWVCHKTANNNRLRISSADVSCKGCFSCLATSDDQGKTWNISAVSTQEGSREASIAQLDAKVYPGSSTSAVIYASERNMGASSGIRWHAVSTDSGKSFSSFGLDPSLPDGKTANWTGICAGLARVDNTLLFSTPMATGARADLGFYRSTDESSTWSSGVLFSAGPAGYSDVTSLNETHAAIVWENGAQEFSQQINFATVRV